jgi:hypothetical protein
MKKLIVSAVLLALLARPASALCPSGWMYVMNSGQHLYDNTSGRWHFVQPSSGVCGVNMRTSTWYRFEQTALRMGWSYWQWPFVYDADTSDWYFIAGNAAPWMYDFAEGRWSRMGEQPVNLPSGTWAAAAANTFSLTVTVDTAGTVSGAYLKVYYNDGWLGNDSYTFSSADITQEGAMFTATKEKGTFNAAGDSLYFYAIIGTFQANGTITGSFKGSYYQDPIWSTPHMNTREGNFTATR